MKRRLQALVCERGHIFWKSVTSEWSAAVACHAGDNRQPVQGGYTVREPAASTDCVDNLVSSSNQLSCLGV